MYLQITTKCNMSCAHCGFSCGPRGKHMDMTTFKNSLKYIDDYVTIGGGEPTLHPNFYEILCTLMSIYDVHIITNGSVTKRALLLAKMAKKGVIGAELSQDEFHDNIDYEVIKAFTKDKNKYRSEYDCDNRGIRTVTNLLKHGRAKKNEIYINDTDCICGTEIITPTGDYKFCGCKNSLVIGNINNKNFNIPDAVREYQSEFECWNHIDRKTKRLLKNGL